MLVQGRFASLILLIASTAFFSLVTQSKCAVDACIIHPVKKATES